MTDQIDFKTCRKMALKCPEGLSGQCCCSSLSPASKEQNPVIAICHALCACVYFAAEVSSTGPKRSWVLLIQSKKWCTEQKTIPRKQLTTPTDKHPTGFCLLYRAPQRCVASGRFLPRRCCAASAMLPCSVTPLPSPSPPWTEAIVEIHKY